MGAASRVHVLQGATISKESSSLQDCFLTLLWTSSLLAGPPTSAYL